MTKVVFDDTLRQCGLSRKDFAEKTGTQYTTVGKWNDTERPIPSWVDSWLDNYIKAKSYIDIKNKVFEIERVEKK